MATTPDDWLSGDEQRVWRALLAVHARLLDRLDEELWTGHRLRLGDYDVLVQLSEAPDRALRMAELAGRLVLSPSGVTRRVDSMVRQGLVARQRCPDDGRGWLARLTPVGLARLEEAAPTHVAGVRRYLLRPILSADRSALAHLPAALDRVAAALDQPAAELAPAGTEMVGAHSAGVGVLGAQPVGDGLVSRAETR